MLTIAIFFLNLSKKDKSVLVGTAGLVLIAKTQKRTRFPSASTFRHCKN